MNFNLRDLQTPNVISLEEHPPHRFAKNSCHPQAPGFHFLCRVAPVAPVVALQTRDDFLLGQKLLAFLQQFCSISAIEALIFLTKSHKTIFSTERVHCH